MTYTSKFKDNGLPWKIANIIKLPIPKNPEEREKLTLLANEASWKLPENFPLRNVKANPCFHMCLGVELEGALAKHLEASTFKALG